MNPAQTAAGAAFFGALGVIQIALIIFGLFLIVLLILTGKFLDIQKFWETEVHS